MLAAFFGLPTLLLEGYEASPCYDSEKWGTDSAIAEEKEGLLKDMCAWRRISDIGTKQGPTGTYAQALKVRRVPSARLNVSVTCDDDNRKGSCCTNIISIVF